MDLSIIIPVFNEEPAITPLVRAIEDAMAPTGRSFEVIIVDDGSTDGSFAVAEQRAREVRFMRIVKLRTNFGQTAALHAGIAIASGSIIVTMDGDLQNDPADIPALVGRLEEGFDMVAGFRSERKDHLISRRIPSRVANWLIRNVVGLSVRDNGCALRAYRSDVMKRIPLYSEMHRLLPLVLSLTGLRISEISVRHHARPFGKSKYGLSRIYKVILDLMALKWVLTRHKAGLLGFGMSALVISILNLPILAGIIAAQFVDPVLPIVVFSGTFLLIGALGVFLLMIGILAELIYRTGYQRIDFLMSRKRVIRGRGHV